MTKQFRSTLIACNTPVMPSVGTVGFFDQHYREPRESALSQFHSRLYAINKLVPSPAAFDSLQGQLILLGVVAAVESYIRTLVSRVILVDSVAQQAVERLDVAYAAARHLPPALLPEALLEKVSFSSKGAIVAAMRDLLGIKGNVPTGLDTALDEYARVCQLRHCAVHRFGKLGASNAVHLGLVDHVRLMEKPLALDYVALQNVILVCTVLVRTLNNALMNELLSRIPASEWTGVYSADRQRFGTYYALFADRRSTIPTAQARQLYAQFFRQRRQHAASV